MVEFRRDPDGTLWSYEEGVRIARVITTEDILLDNRPFLSAASILEDQQARSLGLDRYAALVRTAGEKDVSRDPDFQRAFNAFYRIRRGAEWQKAYYQLFERARRERLSFADVIRALYEKTGNVEASFSSKMIATLDPDKPVWDRYVLRNLELELKGGNPEERIGSAVSVYEQIVKWYQGYLSTDEAKKNIAAFDQRLPSYAWISAVKKIDYLLWSRREGGGLCHLP